MIRIDSRVGSAELQRYFVDSGISTELGTLAFGDFAFEGNGPSGRVAVAIERKQLAYASMDMTQSMFSGRFHGHQLPGMTETYDYAYLVIEGIWRHGKSGELEISYAPGQWKPRRVQARAVVNYAMSLALRAGVIPWRSTGPQDTADFIVDQYRLWQKPWYSHKSHDAIYAPADPNTGMGICLNPRKATFREKVFMQIPGLDDKAKFAAKHFKTAREAANASAEEWANIVWETRSSKSRRLGPAMGRKIESIWGSEL